MSGPSDQLRTLDEGRAARRKTGATRRGGCGLPPHDVGDTLLAVARKP